MTTYAVVAGGGTAGHVLPGIAIGQALVSRGHPPETLVFVGSSRGVESRLVPEAGFELVALPGRGIARRLTLANLGAVWGLLRALAQAFRLVRVRRPSVVVALGGYASVACVVAAAAQRVPIVVAEQNAVPGLANRLASRFARASAASFPDTGLRREVFTGNPVRPEILAVRRDEQRAEAREALGLPPDRTIIVAFGGSLGARQINEAVLEAAATWAARDDLAIRHIIGTRDFADVRARAGDPPPGGLMYQAIEYEDRMDLVYAAADLVVCRSGATTVAELAVTGTPAIMVPLPYAPGDHQTANARALVSVDGGRMIVDDELDGERLVAEVEALLGSEGALDAMARNAASVGRRDAADAVADLVEAHAR